MEARIQAYIRHEASRPRETEQIGPFLATFSPATDNPYLSYAIPDAGAKPTARDVSALIAAFEKRGRKPRLEYFAGLAPDVEAALLAAGFVVEARLPLMLCAQGEEKPIPVPPGIELLRPNFDAELLAMVAAQNEAFNAPAPGSDDTEYLRKGLEAGMIAVLAREVETGEAAGGGVCTAPYDRLTEVAGIGVRAAFRRRGIAAALTTRLVQEAFAAGVTLAFLTPAGEAEERIYGRAGFRSVGEILHISRPTE